MAIADITAARVRAEFHYDPSTGLFTRRESKPGRNGRAGTVCGGPDRKGHIYITIEYQRYAAHRLAWLYVYGEWPKNMIDHVNGAKADNRIENLRDVDAYINQQNRRQASSRNKLGVLGVSKQKNRYVVSIWRHGKNARVGSYLTIEAAQEAYLSAKRQFHEGCSI